MRAAWGFIRGVLALIGALVIILVVIVAILAWNFQKPTQMQQQMRPVTITSDATQRFEQTTTEFMNALQSSSVPPGTQLEIIATEEELSSAATQLIDRFKGEIGVPMTIQEVQVNLSPGSVIMTVSARGALLFMNLNVAVRARVDFKDEGENLLVSWDIQELDLGNAPEQIKKMIRDNIGNRMQGSEILRGASDFQLQDFSLVEKDGKIAVRLSGVKVA